MSRLRSSAPAFVKRVVWNWKHRDHAVEPGRCPEDLLNQCLAWLSPNSALLDLGCGAGNLRAALRLNNWNGYFFGVDVSARAIEVARTAADPNAEWHVHTMEDFPKPARQVDVICLCESIYYMKLELVPKLLERCRESLVSPGGHILMRLWHADRHADYITLLSQLGAECRPPLYIIHTNSDSGRRRTSGSSETA